MFALLSDSPETHETLERLDTAFLSGLSPRERERCACLADSLRRPARIGLFGTEGSEAAWILQKFVGLDLLDFGLNAPTIALSYGATARTSATLSDGSMIDQDGLPTVDLLAHDPLLVQITAPAERLRHMSVLCLMLDHHPDEFGPALAWASQRVEIGIWCTESFSGWDAQIWATAPESLKNYAYLVVTGALDAASLRASRIVQGFDGVFGIPRSGGSDQAAVQLAGLRTRLFTDIDEAHRADLDAAKMFLHRLGKPQSRELSRVLSRAIIPEGTSSRQETPEPSRDAAADLPQSQLASALGLGEPATPENAPQEMAALTPQPQPSPFRRAQLSEPLHYLKRRARALLEILEWQEMGPDWPKALLEHCADTTAALRERSDELQGDDGVTLDLQSRVEETCDMTLLLALENGPEQAETAAILLQQLRGAFETALAA